MGNMHCPAEDVAQLASIARDICPFPNYNAGPHFLNTLLTNSSDYLKNHYAAVQTSLTPKQLQDFNRGLRTIVGREGKVTLGSAGVVALSLAVLFDTLSRQVKGQWVPDSEPIPDLFLKDPRGIYSPDIHTISTYLRLVPHIANNPSRMKEETERYLRKIIANNQTTSKPGKDVTLHDDITAFNDILVEIFTKSLYLHLARITHEEAVENKQQRNTGPRDDSSFFSFNCDAVKASKTFLAEVQKSDNRTQEALQRCWREKKKDNHETVLHFTAMLAWMDAIWTPVVLAGQHSADLEKNLIANREDFDLKANALRNWEE